MAKRKQKGPAKFADIGARLTLTRSAFSLNQTEFADRAGLKQNTYNQYEKGAKQPLVKNAIALCNTYNLTLDWIYRGDPSGLPYQLANTLRDLRKA